MNYVERHFGDWARDTAHLSMLEDGAYNRLCDLYYVREAPLPAELSACCRLVRATSRQEREAVRSVLEEFFDLGPDGWTHKRCDEEIEKFRTKSDKASASAKARWDRRGAHSEGNAIADANASADAMRTHSEGNATRGRGRARSHSPSTKHQEEISNLAVAPTLPPEERPQLSLVEPPAPKAKGPPDCPHGEVLTLWHEVLPQLPQHLASQWRGTRADHLRARWRETAVEKAWATQQQGLEYFRKLFGYVGRSEFLTGRARPSPGSTRPFVIELEWLVNPSNWAKVHEGKYHPETA